MSSRYLQEGPFAEFRADLDLVAIHNIMQGHRDMFQEALNTHGQKYPRDSAVVDLIYVFAREYGRLHA